MSERDCLGRRALIDRSEQVRKVDQRAGFRTWHCRLPYVEEYNSMEQKTIGRRCTKCDLKDYTYCCGRVNFQEQPPISRYQSRQF
jgi:hypothetical protein